MKFEEQRPYIGHMAQLFEVKEYRMLGGRADGLRAVDVDNGSGLHFTVLPDRCCDFGKITFQGKNVSFISPCGYVAPQYYENPGANFLRSFTAGTLTTCGFNNIGGGCVDNGETLGVHGRLSNTAAEQFSARCVTDEDGTPRAELHGVMRHAVLFGENLLLTRDICCSYGDNTIYFNDTIENIGYHTAPLMRLYHINLGYPLIDEDAQIFVPAKETTPRNDHAASMLDSWDKLMKPRKNFDEMCYYHRLKTDAVGNTAVGVYNPKSAIGMFIEFDTSSLDRLIEWKSMNQGNYALGLEPANAWVGGRADARASGDLKFIEAGEVVKSSFALRFVAGESELNDMKRKLSSFR